MVNTYTAQVVSQFQMLVNLMNQNQLSASNTLNITNQQEQDSLQDSRILPETQKIETEKTNKDTRRLADDIDLIFKNDVDELEDFYRKYDNPAPLFNKNDIANKKQKDSTQEHQINKSLNGDTNLKTYEGNNKSLKEEFNDSLIKKQTERNEAMNTHPQTKDNEKLSDDIKNEDIILDNNDSSHQFELPNESNFVPLTDTGSFMNTQSMDNYNLQDDLFNKQMKVHKEDNIELNFNRDINNEGVEDQLSDKGEVNNDRIQQEDNKIRSASPEINNKAKNSFLQSPIKSNKKSERSRSEERNEDEGHLEKEEDLKPSSKENVEGAKSDTNLEAPNPFDNVPVANTKKTFEQLLEEELLKQGVDPKTSQPPVESKPVAKKPAKRTFLRKNAGKSVTNRLKQQNIGENDDNNTDEIEQQPEEVHYKPKKPQTKSKPVKEEQKPSVANIANLMNEIDGLMINDDKPHKKPTNMAKIIEDDFKDDQTLEESLAEFKHLESLNLKEQVKLDHKVSNKAYLKEYNNETIVSDENEHQTDPLDDIFDSEPQHNKSSPLQERKKRYQEEQEKRNKQQTAKQQENTKQKELADIKKEIEKKFNEKIAELEKEIANYKTKNDKLKIEKAKLDERARQVEKEEARLEEERENQAKELEEIREAEMRKIKREKQIAQRNMKAMENKPNRKEREEIEGLKDQLKKLEEEHLVRETRAKAKIERQKKQIEELQKDNEDLKNTIIRYEKMRLDNSGFQNDEESVEKIKETKEVKRAKTPVKRLKTPDTLKEPRSKEEKQVSTKQRINKPKEEKNEPKQGDNKVHKKIEKSRNDPSATVENIYKSFINIDPNDREFKIQIDEKNYRFNTNKYYLEFLEENKKRRKLLKKEILDDGRIQNIYEGNVVEVVFPNGARRKNFPKGYSIVHFANEDVKQVLPDETTIYYYKEHDTTQITLAKDNTEIYRFAEGQVEFHYPDGNKEIKFPNGTEKYIYPNGEELTLFNDGSVQSVTSDGVKIIEYTDETKMLLFPNGQKLFVDETGLISAHKED